MGALRRPLLGVLVALLAACGGAATASPSAPLATEPPSTDEPVMTEAPTATPDLVTELASGAWRRKPVGAPQGYVTAHETACRATLPAIGAQPLAVVDLRGDGIATLVFGDMTAGAACWVNLDDPETPLEARILNLTAGAPDGIDAVLYEPIEGDGQVRTFVIGRVGPMSEPRDVLGDQNPAFVIAGFDDETFVWGAYANGWYAIWWPGNDEMAGVSITNGRNEVLDSVDPDLGP